MVGSATIMLEIEVVICSLSGFILKRETAIYTDILMWNYQETRQKQYKSIIFGPCHEKYIQLYAEVRKYLGEGESREQFQEKEK